MRIELLGNIEFPHEVAHCVERGSDGIGLYRTEFLYLGAECEPDEEVHYQAYAEVIAAIGRRPVVDSHLDLGADKVHRSTPRTSATHTSGCAAFDCRCENLPLFRTQLRAILRASALGDVRLMFPLVTTLLELRQAKMVLADVMEDLDEHGVAVQSQAAGGHDGRSPGGGADDRSLRRRGRFPQHRHQRPDRSTRWRSIAATRKWPACTAPADPAVLRLIRMVLVAADAKGVPVNVCGRMSGDPLYTLLLLGLGLRRLSVTPSAIPEIKKLCRTLTIPQCQALAERVMAMEHARDIKNYLREELKKILPEAVV